MANSYSNQGLPKLDPMGAKNNDGNGTFQTKDFKKLGEPKFGPMGMPGQAYVDPGEGGSWWREFGVTDKAATEHNLGQVQAQDWKNLPSVDESGNRQELATLDSMRRWKDPALSPEATFKRTLNQTQGWQEGFQKNLKLAQSGQVQGSTTGNMMNLDGTPNTAGTHLSPDGRFDAPQTSGRYAPSQGGLRLTGDVTSPDGTFTTTNPNRWGAGPRVDQFIKKVTDSKDLPDNVKGDWLRQLDLSHGGGTKVGLMGLYKAPGRDENKAAEIARVLPTLNPSQRASYLKMQDPANLDPTVVDEAFKATTDNTPGSFSSEKTEYSWLPKYSKEENQARKAGYTPYTVRRSGVKLGKDGRYHFAGGVPSVMDSLRPNAPWYNDAFRKLGGGLIGAALTAITLGGASPLVAGLSTAAGAAGGAYTGPPSGAQFVESLALAGLLSQMNKYKATGGFPGSMPGG